MQDDKGMSYDITHIGDRSLKQLRDGYRRELFERFIPNMDRLIIDHNLGGFMCDINNENGEQITSSKRAWFEGRGIWVYSFLYNHFGKNPDFLSVARKSKDFILKNLPSNQEFWISSFSREGVPTSGLGDIFGNLYIAEGLLEYSIASNEFKYFDLAKSILLQSVERYDRPDYIYSLEKSIKGPRVLNHWMIILRNCTQMLLYKYDAEIELLAERCVDAIMNYHVDPVLDLLMVTLSHDLKKLPNVEFSEKINFGLAIQTLWIVFFEADRKKDILLFNKAKSLFKRHVDLASDNVYGGYYWSLDELSSATFRLGKTLSLHDEVLIGSMFLIKHSADDWAKETFSKTYEYMQKTFIKSELAFPVESGDRKFDNFSKNGMGIYHHPRQLMLNLLAIEKMNEHNRKT